MNVCMVGTGYVGLVTGTCFAEFGNNVFCVDKDRDKIEMLVKGTMPIFEPNLDVMVAKNVKEGRLHFTTDLAKGIENSLVIFIAVGTPPKEDGSADLKHVVNVATSIAELMKSYKVIVNKSTVPVGSARLIRKIVQENLKHKVNFGVISNPEFLREGSAIEDFMRPDRVVIGSDSDEATAIMKDLYAPLYLIEKPFVITNLETAELIKYASNAFLATKISYINELANLCEKVGADIHDIALGMGLDNRIGRKFLHPGPGFGGSCFPKDTRALVQIGREHGAPIKIVETVIEVNDKQPEKMIEKIKAAVGDLNGKRIGVLGLSFKPNTDDMREAPSIPIIKELQKLGAQIRAYDPVAMGEAKKMMPDLVYCAKEYDVAQNADCLVFMTEWNQFRSLDLPKLKSLLAKPIICDLRNIYEPGKMRELGFIYITIGRI